MFCTNIRLVSESNANLDSYTALIVFSTTTYFPVCSKFAFSPGYTNFSFSIAFIGSSIASLSIEKIASTIAV